MAQLAYLDFDLLVERWQEQFKVRVINSPAGQAANVFSLPFSATELNNLLRCIGQTRLGARHLAPPQEAPGVDLTPTEAAKALGGRLYEAVFSDEMLGCLRSSLDEASRRKAGLRLRLRLAEAPELADLPWEYLYHAALNRFFSLSAQTPIIRYLDLPERIQPLAVQPPIKILTMISSPQNYEPLDVDREWAKLQEALGDLLRRKLLTLEKMEDATLPALQKRLRRSDYHVFHFIGHGEFDKQAQDGVLLFEDDAEAGHRVSGKQLGALLHDHRPLRLAVLNACEGARSSPGDAFAGAAQTLVREGIPAVIAMQFPITDKAAITFAHDFYGALADGYPVDAAVAEARKAIFSQGNEVEWGTPVLYLRAPDGRIFDMASASDKEGDHLTTKGATKKESSKDRIGKKLSLWLGIVAAAITIITAILGLPKLWEENGPPPAARFFGKVHYEGTNDPVRDATLRVQASEKSDELLGMDKTDSNGWFNFAVKASPEAPVWVVVSKDGHKGYAGTQTLAGNAKIPFRRKR